MNFDVRGVGDGNAKMTDTQNAYVLNIARDFSEVPGPRYRRQGDGSGERFRDVYLWPALQKNSFVHIELDGVEGYSASFLEEAFGGLIREHPELVNNIKDKLEIVGSNSHIVDRIWEYIDKASKQI